MSKCRDSRNIVKSYPRDLPVSLKKKDLNKYRYDATLLQMCTLARKEKRRKKGVVEKDE